MSAFDIVIGSLTLHGDRQPGLCLMPNFTLPSQVPAMTFADSDSLDGEVPTSDRLTNSSFSGDVLPVAADLADLRSLVADLRAAISPRTFTVSVPWLDETYTCYRGSLSISPITWLTVARNEPVFSLTIPCHPVPTPGA
jgi:hypothetical protein